MARALRARHLEEPFVPIAAPYPASAGRRSLACTRLGGVRRRTPIRVSLGILALLGGELWAATASPSAARQDPQVAWQGWRTVRGVVDLAGPRSDGRLVVAAHGRLFLLRAADGRLSSYPTAGTPYAADPKLEPYIAVAGPRQAVPAAGCSFPRDTVYAIEPAGQPAVLAIAPSGRVRQVAAIRGVKTLNGITFDTGGRFGGRLLVVGLTAAGRGLAVAVDCRGGTHVLTRTAPHLEGGLAMAPAGFGAFAGDLLAPDEVDGRLLALAPDGSIRDVVAPGQPAGGDIGVESLGVVPSTPGDAYLADRRSPGNAHPGHDAILRLTPDDLRMAGVAPGDLVVALEGGGTTIDVRCAATCSVRTVARAPSGAHPEGSISFAS